MNYLQNILINIGFGILGIIPSKALYHICNLGLLLLRYRKQVINNNYKSTIGHALSEKDQKTFYKKCISNISRILIETIKFKGRKMVDMNYQDITKVEEKCKNEKGLILMASHYGNWELACILLARHTTIPCYGVYKPLKNIQLDSRIKELRSTHGLNLVPMNRIARIIADNHSASQPAIYILIADQNPRSIQNVQWVEFLGIQTAFSKGPEKLHKKYHLPLAYMKVKPGVKMYSYDIQFEHRNDSELDAPVKWYAHQLEKQILHAPEYWLWSHKRWKRKYKPQEPS